MEYIPFSIYYNITLKAKMLIDKKLTRDRRVIVARLTQEHLAYEIQKGNMMKK